MRFGTYAQWIGALVLWAAVVLAAHNADAKLIDTWLRRGRKVRRCSTEWSVPRCIGCGKGNRRRSHPTNPCDTRFCALCAARMAKREERVIDFFVRAHPPCPRASWYSHTIALVKANEFSVNGIRADLGRLASAWSSAWDTLFSRTATRVADVAAKVAFEVGPEGVVHVHVLRYGPFVQSDRIRDALSAVLGERPWTHDELVWGRGDGRTREQGQTAIRRHARYLLKGATKAAPGRRIGTNPHDDEREYEFVHPMLVIAFELALGEGNRVRTYGGLRGAKKRRREHIKERVQEHISSERDLDRLNERFMTPPACECGCATQWEHDRRSQPRAPREWADAHLAAPAVEDQLRRYGRPLFVARAPMSTAGSDKP